MPRTLNRRAAFKSAPSKLATLTRRFHHRCTSDCRSLRFLFFSFLSLCRSVILFLVFSPAVVFIFFVRPFESNTEATTGWKIRLNTDVFRLPTVRLYEATAATFDRAFALANRSKEFGETRVNLLRAYICTYYIGAG